ncbi:hypothetical protein O181_104717 [Austropuccinia psidii MF-1]|uniref:Uncharacterized protein n=1 Tax=Austropuccinia psidii MF-1 TaxID=1389203 RepID=A0A9Q3JM90_9BASI|nr:hypothetical protein [Austropuccinia psidii MF-1]
MNDVNALMGWRSNQQICQRPKIPIISDFENIPKNIPIDFFRPEWFNQKNHSKKQIVADLSEGAFVTKYWHSIIKEYKIESDSPDSIDKYSVTSSIGDESVDLNVEHDVYSNFLKKEIIKSEKREVELEPKENKRIEEVSEDVVMTDAWDSRFAWRNWRMEGF